MKLKKHKYILVLGVFLVFVAASQHWQPTYVKLSYPETWPEPHYKSTNNPLTKEGIWLGRNLFYDPVLSADSTISCASCHLSFTSFTHVDHALSHGINDSIGTRNSPVLVNLAWNTSFMWDGAVNHLDVQALAPIAHPAEMGENIQHVVQKLNRLPRYKKWFYAAYGDSVVTGEHTLKALAQFQLTLISSNSKYDKVMAGNEVFNDQEQKGYQLFQQHCNRCHQEPLFTTGEFANNGLSVDTLLNDSGRMRITLNAKDSLKFKIPTLRNIEFSKPYMHDGRFEHLSEAIAHYSNTVVESPTLDSELVGGISLTSNERVDILAFLLTLSDRAFMFNPELGYPKKMTP
tara:strand:+ start:1512 stop:2549 length:1038 start_codon:yes stop_codon:yes gene_type:complete